MQSRALEQAHRLYQTGDYVAALRQLDEILVIEPRNVDALFERALVKDGLNDHDGVLADYTTAMQLAPYNYGVAYNRGLAYQRLGKHEQALEDFKDALRRHRLGCLNEGSPEDPMTTADCLTAIATALNVLGRFDEARDMALEAREFDPGSIFAYEFLSSQDKAPDAPEWLAQFDKALRVNPGDDRLYALRARVQLASGDTEAGFMSLEKAIRIAPMDRDHRVLALDWLMKHERWPELEAQCSAAMKLAGEDAEFLAARAYARAKLGAFAPMLEDIALVEKCAPDDANQLYNCACALGVALSAAPDDAPGVRRKALVLLHQALTRGLNEPASIVVDVDLIPLRNDPEFQQLTRDFA